MGRDLDRRGIYPPVQVLPSLSRLMDAGTGEGYTHPDHPALANQLFSAYAKAMKTRVLESVMGEEGLTDTDRAYLSFANDFEEHLVQQDTARSLEQSMELGWRILKKLPGSELNRLNSKQIQTYIEGGKDA